MRRQSLFIFISIVLSNVVYCQVSTEALVRLDELDQDHPLLDNPTYRNYFNYDLDDLYSLEEKRESEISLLFNSIDYYLKKDSCIEKSTKLNLINTTDSLKVNYSKFIESAHTIEYLSYGDGNQAGYRSLIMKISFQDIFYEHLKYWANSIYYSYLEEGVFDCN